MAPGTVIVGNGDVMTREDGTRKARESGVDGVMIGRGIFQNLFVFNEVQTDHTLQEMLAILKRHIELYRDTWGEKKSYEPLKKFYKVYVRGFDGSSEIRAELMQTKSYDQALMYINTLLN